MFAVTPYIGIGYRYLENDGNNKQSSTGHYGYMRQSNYVYMPLGVLLDYRPENWIIQSKVEFDWMFYGLQYSGVDGGVRNIQHSGYGFNANLQVGQPLSANTAWLVGPYVEYWNIPDSQVSAGTTNLWMEPKNNTIEAGLMLTYLF